MQIPGHAGSQYLNSHIGGAREVARDVTNFTLSHQPQQEKQSAPGSSSTATNSRIPQPSIINSATGCMNQSKTSMNAPESEANGPPTKTSTVKQPNFLKAQKGGIQKSGEETAPQSRHSLQNPMIIDKKFNINAASRQSFNVSSNQASQRYHGKDGHLQQTSSQSTLTHNVTRKASHNNVSSLGSNNVFKRLRQTGTSHGSATGNRFHPSQRDHGRDNAQRNV